MSGLLSRTKGRRGQLEARHLLESRGWSVVECNSGTDVEDFLALTPSGNPVAVEVKNCRLWTLDKWRGTIKERAKRRNLKAWLLMARIPGRTGFWYVEGASVAPTTWMTNDAIGGTR